MKHQLSKGLQVIGIDDSAFSGETTGTVASAQQLRLRRTRVRGAFASRRQRLLLAGVNDDTVTTPIGRSWYCTSTPKLTY